MKIYTKTGDKGETGLVGGARVPKDSDRIAAMGDIDELNSSLGLARCEASGKLGAELGKVQSWLFEIGAELATPPQNTRRNDTIGEAQVRFLEQSIDSQTEELPPLRHFILPGGGGLAAQLHHARSVCRRAERQLLVLNRTEHLRSEMLSFLNRLSDWLFVTARTANRLQGVEDIEWQGPEDI